MPEQATKHCEKNTEAANAPQFAYYRRLFLNAFWLLVGDVLSIACALVLASFVRLWLRDVHIPPFRGFLLIPAWCVGAVVLRVVPGWGMGPVEELRRTQILLIAVIGMASVAMVLSKSADVTSRIKFVFTYLISVPLLPLVRVFTKRMLRKRGKWGVPTVIYGTDETVSHVLQVIQEEPGLGYIPYGVFDDQRQKGSMIGDVPVLGGMQDSTPDAQIAILGAPSIPRRGLRRMLQGPLAHYRRVVIIPDLLDIPTLWVSVRDFVGVIGLEVVRNLLNPIARWFKGSAEWCLVVLLSPVWIPLSLVLALLIYLEDRHFPFYCQERVGRHGRVFKTWKFRSMIPDAEEALSRAIEESPDLQEQWDQDCKLKNDPRVTRIGKFLRRTSLDELPQLYNVLTGTMALVGPRPLPPYHQEKLPANVRALRKQVLPGITGLWQVSGRSEVGTEGMVKWDSYYVRNWSPWLDIIILGRTFATVIKRSGAY
jgi:Undecaprenyl-phosphate galactose phosphotransferase WbaP